MPISGTAGTMRPPEPVPFSMWEKHGAAFAIIAGGLLFSLSLLFACAPCTGTA
jgi:hypothetical protein